MCECCEESEPSSALEKMVNRVKEGQLSEKSLIRLLRSVQQKASSSFPTELLSLLEEVEGTSEDVEENQSGG